MPPMLTAPPLASQVGCFTHPALDGALIERVRHEALTIPNGWASGYGDYQSGGWDTLSLLNLSGDPRDVTIGDVDPVPTTLLRQMPATAELIRRLGLRVWWARLAAMTPGTYLWEHRDYQEPGMSGSVKHRIHVPLVTSRASFLVTGGHAVHMRDGLVWRLDPVHVHGACTEAGPVRLHLIIDCHDDGAMRELRATEELPDDCIRELPAPDEEELEDWEVTAWRLARMGFERQAEQFLLRRYFARVLPGDGHSYDMIAGLYESLGNESRAAVWRDRKATTIGGAE